MPRPKVVCRRLLNKILNLSRRKGRRMQRGGYGRRAYSKSMKRANAFSLFLKGRVGPPLLFFLTACRRRLGKFSQYRLARFGLLRFLYTYRPTENEGRKRHSYSFASEACCAPFSYGVRYAAPSVVLSPLEKRRQKRRFNLLPFKGYFAKVA